MRITFVAYHGSVHTRRWVAHFARRGHDVVVVTCGGGDAVDLAPNGEALTRGYSIVDLGAPRFGKLGYLLKVPRARRWIRRAKPDIVHAHWATSYGLLALAAGVRPMALTAHGDDLLIAPRNPLLRWLVRRVLRAASVITVPSPQMHEAAVALLDGTPHCEIAVFQYGVESHRLRQAGDRERELRQPEPSGAPLRIVSTRAMLGLYRLDALLDALALLRDDGFSFTCDLVGDGPERASLERQAGELGLHDLVRFHGSVPAHECERLVARADLYVSVAESDGASLSLLEAMAIGAVPVLSDIPSNREWVRDGINGVLVEINGAAVAGGIRRAAALDGDEVRDTNLAVVLERADREVNLTQCELLLDDLVGVTFEPSGDRADAA